MKFEDIDSDIRNQGWAKIEGVYDSDILDRVKEEFQSVGSVYEAIQAENDVAVESKYATHHTIVLCPTMLKLLDPNPLHDFLEFYFSGKYILNTMGASVVMPHEKKVYTQNIHRDIRSFTGGYRVMVNTLIMLDDSTEDNGATWMLSGSQKKADKPEEAHFYENAVRACGKKGDVLIFDANIWHAAGVNSTSSSRTIITPIYSRPYVKQALDYPRAFGMDYKHRISPKLAQILGYNALVPASLEEFYKPRDKRFYKGDQG